MIHIHIYSTHKDYKQTIAWWMNCTAVPRVGEQVTPDDVAYHVLKVNWVNPTYVELQVIPL